MPAPNNRKCQLETCDRKHWANNYCQKHDRQVREHGHVLTGNYLSKQGRVANAARKTVSGWRWAKEQTNQLERSRFHYHCREKVLSRDNYTCQICLKEAVSPHVDHIKGWAEYPELRLSLDNLRTLCAPCHYYVTFKRKMPDGLKWGQNYKEEVL